MPEVYHRPVPGFILFLRRGPARCHLAVFCPIRRSRSTRPICSLFWEMSAREQELHVPVRVNSRWSTRNSSGAKLSTWSPHAGLVVNAYQAGPLVRPGAAVPLFTKHHGASRVAKSRPARRKRTRARTRGRPHRTRKPKAPRRNILCIQTKTACSRGRLGMRILTEPRP